MHQTPAVILCLVGCSELQYTKNQVIKHANFVLRRRSNYTPCPGTYQLV